MQISKLQTMATAFFAWIAFLVAGMLLLVAWSRGIPNVQYIWIVIGVSSLPWLVTGANLMRRGVPPPVGDFVKASTVEHVRDFHLVPVTNSSNTINGVLIDELIEFIDQIPNRGVSARAWKGDPKAGILPYQFKTGRECDYHTWREVTNMFVEAGILIGREERKKGRMRTTEPGAIKSALRVHRLL